MFPPDTLAPELFVPLPIPGDPYAPIAQTSPPLIVIVPPFPPAVSAFPPPIPAAPTAPRATILPPSMITVPQFSFLFPPIAELPSKALESITPVPLMVRLLPSATWIPFVISKVLPSARLIETVPVTVTRLLIVTSSSNLYSETESPSNAVVDDVMMDASTHCA